MQGCLVSDEQKSSCVGDMLQHPPPLS